MIRIPVSRRILMRGKQILSVIGVCLLWGLLSFTEGYAFSFPLRICPTLEKRLRDKVNEVTGLPPPYRLSLTCQEAKILENAQVQEIEVSCGEDPTELRGYFVVHPSDTLSRSSSHLSEASVSMPSSSLSSVSLRFEGKVDPLYQIPVLNRSLASSEIIAASDIIVRSIPFSSLPEGCVHQAEELIGHSSRIPSLKPWIPVKKRDLILPILVQKNDWVTITYMDDGLILSTQGQAQQNGAKGQTISFLLSPSKKTIQAKIITAHTAEFQVIHP